VGISPFYASFVEEQKGQEEEAQPAIVRKGDVQRHHWRAHQTEAEALSR
jgi:hypothetical protein